jgi:FkbM family methyltransferase
MSGIVSYAQNFEDVMLWRALQGVGKGFYIDIGAQHPVVDSVSLAFYEKGWRGIHVEPNPAYANLLREQRMGDIVIQAAISTRRGLLVFFEIPQTGLSTADPEIAERHRRAGYEVHETSVPCLPLSELFQQAQGRDIHWLKIDVEGWEKEVLQSWGQSKARPWIVVVESTFPLTQEESFQAWEELLLKRGYRFVYFDGLNRYYVHESHGDLLPNFRVPPNYFDHFSLAESTPYCAALRQSLAELKAQAEQARQRADRLQEGLQKEQARCDWLEGEWNGAKRRIEELAAELALVQEAERRRSEELEAARQSLAETRAAFEQAQARSLQLEAELAAARAEVEELNARSLQLQNTVAEREKQLAAVHASWSWKVTAPLRFGYDLALISLRLAEKAFAFGRKALLWPLLAAMRWVLRDPLLAERINRKILRYPWLHRRLRALAIGTGLMATPAPSPPAAAGSAATVDPAQLSPRARQIYEDLKAALAQRR